LVASDTVSGQLCVASLDAISVGGVARDAFDRPVAFNQEEAKDGAKLKVGIFAAGATEDPLGIASGALTKISEVATITSGTVDVVQAIGHTVNVVLVDGAGSAVNVTNGTIAVALHDQADGKAIAVTNKLVGTYLADTGTGVPVSVVDTTVGMATQGQLCTTTSLPEGGGKSMFVSTDDTKGMVLVYNTPGQVVDAIAAAVKKGGCLSLKAHLDARKPVDLAFKRAIELALCCSVVADAPRDTFIQRLSDAFYKSK